MAWDLAAQPERLYSAHAQSSSSVLQDIVLYHFYQSLNVSNVNGGCRVHWMIKLQYGYYIFCNFISMDIPRCSCLFLPYTEMTERCRVAFVYPFYYTMLKNNKERFYFDFIAYLGYHKKKQLLHPP